MIIDIITLVTNVLLSLVAIIISIRSSRQTSKDATRQIESIKKLTENQIDLMRMQLDAEIQKNLQEPTFSIDTLAEIMCMSRSNFYRKIKGISGMSPNDYLKTIRLKMAAELLLQQEYRINEIYELVGFSSSSYFTKCFKEQFGVPPKEFLNNAKNNAGNKSSEIVT